MARQAEMESPSWTGTREPEGATQPARMCQGGRLDLVGGKESIFLPTEGNTKLPASEAPP